MILFQTKSKKGCDLVPLLSISSEKATRKFKLGICTIITVAVYQPQLESTHVRLCVSQSVSYTRNNR